MSAGLRTWERDATDRVVEVTSGDEVFGYAYDGDDVSDNLTRITRPSSSGVVQDRAYDQAGRLTSVDNRAGDAPHQ